MATSQHQAYVQMPDLIYHSLLPPRTIRLLELHPGGPSSELLCTIRQFCLDEESVEYRALSYCWEGSTKPATLYVDGIPVKIGQNLSWALHQLRTNLFFCTNLLCSCSDDYCYPAIVEKHTTSPELLWIDALCIYSYRTAIKTLKNLRVMPQFSEGLDAAWKKFPCGHLSLPSEEISGRQVMLFVVDERQSFRVIRNQFPGQPLRFAKLRSVIYLFDPYFRHGPVNDNTTVHRSRI